MALDLKKKLKDATKNEGASAAEAPAVEGEKAGRSLKMPKLSKGKKGNAPVAEVLTESGESAGYQIPVGKARKGRSYGVDIDGNVVRVVELLDTEVVSYGTYQGVTTDDAFRKFLATKPSGDVNVSWMANNQHVVRVAVPALPESALRLGILDSIEEQLPMTNGTAAIAARLHTGGNGVTMASVAAVDQETTTPLWEMVGSADVNVIPSPLLMTHDGLFLGVRYADANLMLVAGGAIVAARPLAVGGLTSMFEKLGGDATRAAERFATVARGGTRLDPDAAAVVDTYSATIGDEVRRTVDFWARQGNNVPSEVFVHGPGIVLPNLSGKLLDAALFARPVGLPNLSMETIARTERPTAYMALLAAQMDTGIQSIANLVDPRGAEKARRNKEAAKRSLRLFAAIGVGALAIVAFVVPLGFAKTKNVMASNARHAAENKAKGYAKELKLKSDVEAGIKTYNAAVANEIAWEPLYRSMLDSAPPGLNPKFQSLSIAPSDKQVIVSFSATMKNPPADQAGQGGFDTAVAAWIDRLKEKGSKQPWPNSWTVSKGTPATPGADADPNSTTITGSFTAPIDLDPKVPIVKTYLASRELASPSASAATTVGPAVPAATTTVPKG